MNIGILRICLNCEKEFENRSSDYCSTKCAIDRMQVYENLSAKLISNNFERIVDSENKVFEFISNIKNKDHIILLFQNEKIRDTIVTEFFEKSKNRTYTACFAHETIKYKCDKAITYQELSENQKLLTNKISEFLVEVLDESYPNSFPRVACEDTAWFSEAGFFEEHQKLGNKLDKKVLEESAILCCYDTTRLDDIKIDTILQNSGYVILGKPLSVFRRKQSH